MDCKYVRFSDFLLLIHAIQRRQSRLSCNRPLISRYWILSAIRKSAFTRTDHTFRPDFYAGEHESNCRWAINRLPADACTLNTREALKAVSINEIPQHVRN